MNIKSIIHTQFTSDNCPLWGSQIQKLFTVNGFNGFLDGTTSKPPKQIITDSNNVAPNTNYNTWTLIDQNLAAALYSIISSALLQYELNLKSCCDIWKTIERQL